MTPRIKIHRFLMGREEGASLTEIARGIGMAAPPTLHHLRAAVEEGTIERVTSAGSARPKYRASPFFSAFLFDPATDLYASWSTRERPSWKYALVSRVPDADVRASILAFLRRAEAKGLFRPPSKRHPRSLRVAVYGSAARGEMGPRSDVDLLALWRGGRDPTDALRDLAAEANLDAPRRIDLRVFREGTLAEVAGRFAAGVEKDGFVIHSSYEWGEYDPIVVEASRG